MKKINILTVCGSGTFSSTMVAQKLTEVLREKGFEAHCTECNNGQIETQLSTAKYDCMCFTSPCNGTYPIPCINTIGFLTGIGEEEIIEKVLEVARSL